MTFMSIKVRLPDDVLSHLFPVTAAVGDDSTIINSRNSVLLETSKSAFQPNLITRYDSWFI